MGLKYWEKTWNDYPLRTRSEAGSEAKVHRAPEPKICIYCGEEITTQESYFAGKHTSAHYTCVEEGDHWNEGPSNRDHRLSPAECDHRRWNHQFDGDTCPDCNVLMATM